MDKNESYICWFFRWAARCKFWRYRKASIELRVCYWSLVKLDRVVRFVDRSLFSKWRVRRRRTISVWSVIPQPMFFPLLFLLPRLEHSFGSCSPMMGSWIFGRNRRFPGRGSLAKRNRYNGYANFIFINLEKILSIPCSEEWALGLFPKIDVGVPRVAENSSIFCSLFESDFVAKFSCKTHSARSSPLRRRFLDPQVRKTLDPLEPFFPGRWRRIFRKNSAVRGFGSCHLEGRLRGIRHCETESFVNERSFGARSSLALREISPRCKNGSRR